VVGIAGLYVAYQVALREAGVLLGTALAESAPLFVVPLARLLLGERLSPARLLGCALTLAGVACCFGGAAGPVGLRALGAGLLASLAYAVCYVGSALVSKGRAPARVLAAAMPAAALALLPGVRFGGHSPAAWGCIALLALACTYGAYLAKTEALARSGAAVVSALGTLEPLLASALAVVVLREPLSRGFAAGLVLELLGLVLVAWPAAGAGYPNGQSRRKPWASTTG
jgi:probable blue pigment (indigoidine) exporter